MTLRVVRLDAATGRGLARHLHGRKCKVPACTRNEDSITVRGAALCGELIGHIGFSDDFHLLLTRQRPTPAARRVLEATFAAITEHGLVRSVQAARMTLAAAPNALLGAVAAGILVCGWGSLGASETAGGS